MKTRHSIGSIISLIVIGIFTLAIFLFGSFMIYWIEKISFNLNGILMGILFIWIGFGFLVLVIGRIKIMEFHNGILKIRKPLFNKNYENELTKIKYLDFEWQMTWNTMRGILIKLENGLVEQVSIQEFSNSRDFIDLITKSCQRDETIKPKIWTRKLKIFLFIGLIIVAGLVFSTVIQ
jgi:hypothetical protein